MYQQKVKLFSLKNGFIVTVEERKNAKQYDPLEVAELIKIDNHYNSLNQPDKNQYTTMFFIIDRNKNGEHTNYLTIKQRLINFLGEHNIVPRKYPSWTAQDNFHGNYFIVFPEFYCKLNSLRNMVNDFKEKNPDLSPFVNTQIYGNSLLYYPNQTVPNTPKVSLREPHIIQYGTTLDFIHEYIPENSINVDELLR
jgi:hypothetical protein